MTTTAMRMRRRLSVPWVQLIILALVWVLFIAVDPRFASVDRVFGVLQGFAFLGLIAAGVGITIIVGELDLSVGSMAAVGGVVVVSALPLGIVPAILLATAIGGVFGLVQGLLIARLRISSLVFTIGSMFALRGLANVIANEQVVSVPIDQLGVSNALISRIGIISPFSLVTILVVVAVGLFLAYSRFGRELYAVGGGRSESRAAGVPQLRPIGIAFLGSGALASLAGALSSIASGSGAPFAFEPVLVSAITAALIGGLAMGGGKGGMVNIVLGALIVSTFTAGLSLNGVPANVQQLAIGALLLLIIVVDVLRDSHSAWLTRLLLPGRRTSLDVVQAGSTQ
ncbi:ABC transporter permease [Microbacterium sp. LWH3-1.2]|uniref:ABC transporter permease n=1 Tax=Microbacterium sp. LWH3-1.2 TaxID=3135256 RepID=UPI00341F009A